MQGMSLHHDFDDFLTSEVMQATWRRLRFPLEEIQAAQNWDDVIRRFAECRPDRNDILRRAGKWTSRETVLTAFVLAALNEHRLATAICPDPYSRLKDLDNQERGAVCRCVIWDALF
jgi:hypothetical protein